MNNKLTTKQRRFIQEFFKSNNATEASMEAYNCKDRVVAASIGSENLRKPQIREAIKLHLQEEGIDLKTVFRSLKKNMLQGAGRHTKASDSNRAAEILLKVSGAFREDNSFVQHNYLNIDLDHITTSQLLKKKKELDDFFGEIIEGELTD